MMIESINVILVVFMLVSAVAALYVKDLVSASFLTGCFSFLAACLWALLLAADVSFTEALVGSSVATLFFLLALFGSSHKVKPEIPRAGNYWGILLAVMFAGFLLWGSAELPLFGELSAPAHQHVSPYYLLNTLKDMHTPNAVTSVVVDYRGFDTLMETAVIFTAGMACLLILKDKARD